MPFPKVDRRHWEPQSKGPTMTETLVPHPAPSSRVSNGSQALPPTTLVPRITVDTDPSSGVWPGQLDGKPRLYLSKKTRNLVIRLPNGDTFEGKNLVNNYYIHLSISICSYTRIK